MKEYIAPKSQNYTLREEQNAIREQLRKKIKPETLSEFKTFIEQEVEESVKNPVLNALENVELSKEAYVRVRADHYHSADWFIDLLEKGEEKAREIGLTELADEFKQNYKDEMGYDSVTGIQNANETHESWRIDDGKAINVDYTKITPLESTIKTHRDPLKEAISSRDAFYLAGMLAVTEKYLVEEFKKLKKSRDELFPEAYTENTNDSAEIKAQKKRARKYIDDHIHHDEFHYEDILLRSLAAIEKTGPLAEESFKEGCKAVLEAKESLYKGIEENLKQDNSWVK